MKEIRKFTRNPIIAIFMCSLILTISCNSDEAILPEPQIFNGEELFRSIIFMDGEATSLIPLLSIKNAEIYEMLGDQEKIQEYKNLQNEAIEYIKNNSENFFDDFQKAILSKNPEKISTALIRVNDYLVPFAETKLKLHGITTEELIKEYNYNDNNVNIDNSAKKPCLAIIIPVVAVVVAGVALYAWVAVATWVTVTFDTKSTQDKLYIEELSISIAEKL